MSDIKIEKRTFQASIRANGEDSGPVIEGHAAVFNQRSGDLGGFREIIAPGTFRNSIKKGDIRSLWNHNTDLVLGRTKSGTLELKEDKKGLATRITPPDTTWANDAVVTMKRGDVDQMSFAFRTITDKWEKKDGENIRTLLDVELFEVSPVAFPAYPQTDVGVRSVLEGHGVDMRRFSSALQSLEHGLQLEDEDLRSIEKLLQELGGMIEQKRDAGKEMIEIEIDASELAEIRSSFEKGNEAMRELVGELTGSMESLQRAVNLLSARVDLAEKMSV